MAALRYILAMVPSAPSIRLVVAALVLLAAGTAAAGPLEQGAEAYREGNYARAYELWRPLAEKGEADAQYNLGLMYENGRGVDKDPRLALEWYRKAARQNHADAQYNLATLFAQGEGVFRSDREALKWFKYAASQGHPAAEYSLGVMYAYGLGTAKQVDNALFIWERAARHGNRDAAQALARVYEQGLFGVAPDPEKAGRWRAHLGEGAD